MTEDGERTFVTNRNGSLWKLNIDDVDFARFSGEIIITGQYFQQSSIDGRALTEILRKLKPGR